MKSSNSNQTSHLNRLPKIVKYRNRKQVVRFKDVILDQAGNILSMKSIPNLECLGDPVEYYAGRSDQPYYHNGVAQPKGCAMCPSSAACSQLASLRVDGYPDLISKREAWEQDVDRTRSAGGAQYELPSFHHFATACRAKGWTSCNDQLLRETRAKDAKRKRRERAKEKKLGKARSPLADETVSEIEIEGQKRYSALVAAAWEKGAPSWLRNLGLRTIGLTCGVWKIVEMSKKSRARSMTGADIARSLTQRGATHGYEGNSLRARVNEALSRIDRLSHEPRHAPVWGAFVSPPSFASPRSPGHNLNGMVHTLLDGNND